MARLDDYLVKKFVLSDRLSILAEKKRLYGNIHDGTEIVEQQTRGFNAVWERCYKTIPFYTQWRNRHGLPERISSVDDLCKFPSLTKRAIQENHDLIFQNGKIKQYVSTGGSTGEPTRFPSSKTEAIPTYADLYAGRSWYGIQPLDRALVFWGHSHLFGSGWRGVFNNCKRKMYDRVLNTRRLNAYDMSAETVEKYFNVYRRSTPAFILGYTSCLYKLAKYICEHGADCGRKDNLKAVIVTSETVTMSDIELLGKAFKVPVAVEYGMAETGVIAYSRNSPSNLQVFWDSFIGTVGSDRVLSVTTLYDKLFPLINYSTDDRVDVDSAEDGSILTFRSIVGRRRDLLTVGTKKGSPLELSGILMVHILKSYPHIYSIQFEQLEPDGVRLSLVADCQLDVQRVKDYFLREIRKDHKSIDTNRVEIAQVSSIAKTAAGKESLVCVPKS
jgi:phenylacetate-CoA ligase